MTGLGYQSVSEVRQGKFFDIEIEPGEDVETIAREVLINPVIEPVGNEMAYGWEGCLSVPGLRGVVPR